MGRSINQFISYICFHLSIYLSIIKHLSVWLSIDPSILSICNVSASYSAYLILGCICYQVSLIPCLAVQLSTIAEQIVNDSSSLPRVTADQLPQLKLDLKAAEQKFKNLNLDPSIATLRNGLKNSTGENTDLQTQDEWIQKEKLRKRGHFLAPWTHCWNANRSRL